MPKPIYGPKMRPGPKAKPIIERLKAQTPGYGGNGCWVWEGCKDKDGYGQITVGSRGIDRRAAKVHRLAYCELIGPIPDGLDIDHVKSRGCQSRACWNPDHLEPVTKRENMARGNSKAATYLRTNVCIQGHENAPHLSSNGGCLFCIRIRNAAAMRRLRAKRKVALAA